MRFRINFLKLELKKNYLSSFEFIRVSSKFIWGGLSIFLLFIFVGFFVSFPESLTSFLMDYFKELAEKTKDYGGFKMISFLFLNNLKASFLGMTSGIFFGILPLIYLILNGFVLGFASRLAVLEQGIFSLLRLLPHGVFELPAIILSLGLGLKLGSFILEKENLLKSLNSYILDCLRVFIFIILPLLILAAIIEGLLIVLL